MNTILKFMSKDHDELDEIFKKFMELKSADINKTKKLFHDFKTRLQRHIVWEEEVLFPIFEEKNDMHDAGPTSVMKMEHRQIKEFLEKIHNKIITKEMNGVEDLENDLINVLTPHNEKEENILYPWIDDSINSKEKKEVFKKIENIPPDKYNKCCE